MTILKTFIVQIHYNDGSIDNVSIKARTQKLADAIASNRFPEAYIGVVERLKKSNRFWHVSKRREDVFADKRDYRHGRYIFQHKGRRRRGTKFYPTPKRGWRKVTDVTFTWTETYPTGQAEFIESWLACLTPQPRVEVEGYRYRPDLGEQAFEVGLLIQPTGFDAPIYQLQEKP